MIGWYVLLVGLKCGYDFAIVALCGLGQSERTFARARDEDAKQIWVVAIVVNECFVAALVHNEILELEEFVLSEFVHHV
jgi:hypothetical protein